MGSATSSGRHPGRAWLVRLRRGDRSVIVAWGLSDVAAEHVAERITDLLGGAGLGCCSSAAQGEEGGVSRFVEAPSKPSSWPGSAIWTPADAWWCQSYRQMVGHGLGGRPLRRGHRRAVEFALTETGVQCLLVAIARGRSGPPGPDLPGGDRSDRADHPPHPGSPPGRSRRRGDRTQPGRGQRSLSAAADAHPQVRRPRPGRHGRADGPWWGLLESRSAATPGSAQLAWVVHRQRKLGAHQALANQIQSQLDLVFPGLAGCFASLLAVLSWLAVKAAFRGL